jgi:hypothetical protein
MIKQQQQQQCLTCILFDSYAWPCNCECKGACLLLVCAPNDSHHFVLSTHHTGTLSVCTLMCYCATVCATVAAAAACTALRESCRKRFSTFFASTAASKTLRCLQADLHHACCSALYRVQCSWSKCRSCKHTFRIRSYLCYPKS